MRISISIVRTPRAHFPHQCQKMIVGTEDDDVYDDDVDDVDDDDDDNHLNSSLTGGSGQEG